MDAKESKKRRRRAGDKVRGRDMPENQCRVHQGCNVMTFFSLSPTLWYNGEPQPFTAGVTLANGGNDGRTDGRMERRLEKKAKKRKQGRASQEKGEREPRKRKKGTTSGESNANGAKCFREGRMEGGNQIKEGRGGEPGGTAGLGGEVDGSQRK